MEDELSSNVPNICEYSTGNNNNSTYILPVQNEHQIPKMDTGTNQGQQTILSGYSSNLIPDTSHNQVLKNIEEQLELVDISDDDINYEINHEKLDDNNYIKHKDMIDHLYEDEGDVGSYIPTKNEMLNLPEPPKPTLLSEKSKLEELGKIITIVEDSIVIEKRSDLNIIVNLDTTVYSKGALIIGYVFDVIGNIDSPYYVIHAYVNSNKTNTNISENSTINESISDTITSYNKDSTIDSRLKFIDFLNLQTGDQVFFDKEIVQIVDKSKLLHYKGTDASNVFDEEADYNEEAFSDDEEERQFKHQKKEANRIKHNEKKEKNHNNTNNTNNHNSNNNFKQNSKKVYSENFQNIGSTYNPYSNSSISLEPSKIDPFTFVNLQSKTGNS